MAWVRIDDGFPDHRKLISLSLPVRRLVIAIQVQAICYCNRNLTDGYLPKDIVSTLLMAQRSVTSRTMIDLRLWARQGASICIHNYLKYQMSRKQIMELRKLKSKAGQQSAQQRAKHRVQQGVEHPVQQSVQQYPNPNPKEIETISEEQDDFSKSLRKGEHGLTPLSDLIPAFARGKKDPAGSEKP